MIPDALTLQVVVQIIRRTVEQNVDVFMPQVVGRSVEVILVKSFWQVAKGVKDIPQKSEQPRAEEQNVDVCMPQFSKDCGVF